MKSGRWAKFLWPCQNIWTLLVVLCFSWWSWIHELPWTLKINFSSDQRNLIKTFCNTKLILYWSQKNALYVFLDIFGQTLKNQIWRRLKPIFYLKIIWIFLNFSSRNSMNLEDQFLLMSFFLITSISKKWLQKWCWQIV